MEIANYQYFMKYSATDRRQDVLKKKKLYSNWINIKLTTNITVLLRHKSYILCILFGLHTYILHTLVGLSALKYHIRL